jgi:hypothetical protein
MDPVEWAAGGVIVTAMIGYLAGRQVPRRAADCRATARLPHLAFLANADPQHHPAPARVSGDHGDQLLLDDRRGAVHRVPPLAKNVLSASKEVASLFLVIFSIGVAIGSVSINALLKGTVSARYSPWSVIAMGLFIVAFHFVCRAWTPPEDGLLMNVGTFVHHPMAVPLLLSLLGIAVAGGMFVVPLYAFLTTVVDKSETARTIAANNIVNSGAMVVGAALARASARPGGADRPVAAGRGDVPGFRLAGQLLYAAERASADEASPA